MIAVYRVTYETFPFYIFLDMTNYVSFIVDGLNLLTVFFFFLDSYLNLN